MDKITEYLNDKFFLVNEKRHLIYTESGGVPVFVPEEYRKYYAFYKKR